MNNNREVRSLEPCEIEVVSGGGIWEWLLGLPPWGALSEPVTEPTP